MIKTSYLIAPNSHFKLTDVSTTPPLSESLSKKVLKKTLKTLRKELNELQHRLFAEGKNSLLLVFQAMDAAGKDSTIRAVLSGVNPAGCHISSFKKPSITELDHDYLWRSAIRLPERGQIGVFNRSYYEETLVTRVHPHYLQSQHLANLPDNLSEDSLQSFWEARFESINDHEKHLARNGTVIIKFWLNVSKEEQKKRFLSRLNEPEKHWKFDAGDLKERAYWDDYMQAYEQMLDASSTNHAPWYAIPADHKLFMRVEVAKTIVATLKAMSPQYPEVEKDQLAQFDEVREQLLSEE